MLLAELTTGHVQAMVAAVIRQHHALGAPVSAATLTRIRATLRAALNAAIRRGLITENPAASAEPRRASGPLPQVQSKELPASTTRAVPVMKRASSLAKKRTALEISIDSTQGTGRSCKRLDASANSSRVAPGLPAKRS